MERVQAEWLIAEGPMRIVASVLSPLFGYFLWRAIDGPFPDWPAKLTGVLLLVSVSTVIVVYRAEFVVTVWSFPYARHHIPIKDIVGVRIVEKGPFDYIGVLGLKFRRSGLAWTVSGNRGVRLELSSGRHVLIGSRNPERLQTALQLRISDR